MTGVTVPKRAGVDGSSGSVFATAHTVKGTISARDLERNLRVVNVISVPMVLPSDDVIEGIIKRPVLKSLD